VNWHNNKGSKILQVNIFVRIECVYTFRDCVEELVILCYSANSWGLWKSNLHNSYSLCLENGVMMTLKRRLLLG